MQMIQMLIVLLACSMLITTFACDVKETEIGACVKDVELYCKVELFPYTVQSIFDSRDCLRKNRDFVSKECLDYLELDKPSIIESCFVEMKTSCSNVVPGCFNIRSCLSGVSVDELSRGCQEALVQDHEVTANKGSRIALWDSWNKSFAIVSEFVFTTLNQVSHGSYLRGSSVYVEIIENNENKDLRIIEESEQDRRKLLEKNKHTNTQSQEIDDDAVNNDDYLTKSER